MRNLKRFAPPIYLVVLFTYFVAGDVIAGDAGLSVHLRNLGMITFLFLMAQAAPVESNTEPGQPFLVEALLSMFIMGLGVMAVNVYVNPFGLYPTDIYEPVVVNSRNQKVDLYEALDQKPEIVVLGSSRSFTVPVEYIEGLTGKPAFNATVTGGVPRDFLAFFNYLLAQDSLPETFLVGLTIDQMILDYVPLEPDRLAGYVDATPGSNLIYQLQNLFSLDQFETSLQVLEGRAPGQGSTHYSFEANGQGHFFETRPLDVAVTDYINSSWGNLFTNEKIDPIPADYLYEFLSLAHEHDVEVIIFSSAYHPRVPQAYSQSGDYDRLKTTFFNILEDWQQTFDFTVYDFTTVESYGGTDQLFFDASHPTKEGHRLMLDLIFAD